MAQWEWLTGAKDVYRPSFVVRVLVKAALLFIALNFAFALLNPMPLLEQFSVYGWLAAPRLRLSYGENPALSNSLSLDSLDAMFRSHALSQPKAADEYRVLVLGDSSTWGFLLPPDETFAAHLNEAGLVTDDGRQVRAYNLGYPEMSLTKDVLLLDYAMRYEPDMIVWLITLESFAPERQLSPRLVRANADAVRRLNTDYEMALDVESADFIEPTFFERTLVGQRRAIADWLRLQMYGFAWTVTGIDQHLPDEYELRSSDFEADFTWHEFDASFEFSAGDIAFASLEAGLERAGDVPVLIVNEPMFISSGENSDIRYNFFYPRWAYDRYRELLAERAAAGGWQMVDVWNLIEPDEFTDSPVHMTPRGMETLAGRIAPDILSLADEAAGS